MRCLVAGTTAASCARASTLGGHLGGAGDSLIRDVAGRGPGAPAGSTANPPTPFKIAFEAIVLENKTNRGKLKKGIKKPTV